MRTTKPKATTPPPAEDEKPVLYFVGPGKATVPERDLYAADLTRRSKQALIQTGSYVEKKP